MGSLPRTPHVFAVMVWATGGLLTAGFAAVPAGTTFTYQGQLKHDGAPLNGVADFEFVLWNAEIGGTTIGGVDPHLAVEVVNGLFIVPLDFGSAAFNGDARWLEVAVRYPHDPADTGPFTALAPRQPMTATPYALQTRGLFVDDTLNVGIGTRFPGYPLDVQTDSVRAVSAATYHTEGYGVQGLALSNTGANYGVLGQSLSPDGTGVYGWASATTGLNYGVYGLSWSTSGHGIHGLATAATGTTYGVYGRSVSDQGAGVYGEAASSTGETTGVTGRSLSTGGTGVLGFAHALSGANVGIWGWTRSDSGRGVYGWASASSGTNYGVYGKTASPDGYAGYFEGGRNFFEGNVGIGTTTPGERLDVDGAIKATGTIGSSGSIIIDGTGATGIVNNPTGDLSLQTGGTARIYIDHTSGGVGIGTTTPDNSTLDVVSGITARAFRAVNTVNDNSVRTGVYGEAASLRGRGVYGEATGDNGKGVHGFASSVSGTNYGVYGVTSSPDGYAGYFSGGRNYFEGKVGIGTTAPEYPLHVETSGTGAVLGEMSGTVGSGVHGVANSTAAGLLSGVKGDTYSPTGRGVLGVAAANTGVNYGVYGMTFSSSGHGIHGQSVESAGYAGYFEGGKNYFEGNVGIGTDSPTAKLELGGANANIKMYEDGGSPFLGVGDNTTTVGWLQWNSANDRLDLYTYGHGFPIAIGPTASGGVFVDTEANGGDVGIGTEAPQAKLQVDAPTGADPFRVRIAGTTKFVVKSNGYTAVGANIAPAFQLQVAGDGTAGKPGGGSWAVSSDRRLKKNVHDLDGALERLMTLRGVTFEYIDPAAINELGGERIGMIAQEVEPVFPDWVSEGGHGYKTLTFRGFEALAVEALRELRAEKDRQVQELQSRNADLESRVAQLEALVAQFVVHPRPAQRIVPDAMSATD